jgi:type IV pilus assembly protein PilM
MQVMPGADADAPLRLAVSGRLLDRTNPLANVSPDTSRRVAELLARLAESPFVSAVEHERFDPGQPGVLRFDVVLISQPARPL